VNRQVSAHIIIHSFALTAAGFSGAYALVPVAGPILFDTATLTALTVGMTYALGSLFNKKLEENSMWSFATVAIGFASGNAIFKAFSSLIPIYGSAVNATTTFVLHEAIGWGLFLIFESGKDPTKLSKKEIQDFIEEGKERAKNEKDNYEKIMSSLPPNERIEIEILQKKLTEKSISEEEKRSILEKITRLIAKD
jgi:uncharacterized protein (DUF697 family)